MQKVIEANKKQLQTILTDPKKLQKQMLKALDISFVDPEKNKTPEVQAYQKLPMKDFKEAGPFNSDNPAEHEAAQAIKAQLDAGKGAYRRNASSQQLRIVYSKRHLKAKLLMPDGALAKDMPHSRS